VALRGPLPAFPQLDSVLPLSCRVWSGVVRPGRGRCRWPGPFCLSSNPFGGPAAGPQHQKHREPIGMGVDLAVSAVAALAGLVLLVAVARALTHDRRH
jgi:hypothetical protein